MPLVAIVIGEGGSGGALALSAANSVLMLEHAIYTVASPEACASILWRTSEQAAAAAAALKVTAADLKALGVIDRIIVEPVGGAHRDVPQMLENVGQIVADELDKLGALAPDDLRRQRRQKFLDMGRAGFSPAR